MLPEYNITIELQAPEEDKPLGRSFFFDFTNKTFVVEAGKIKETTQEQAIEQWIQLCIKTTLNKYPIYQETGFGTNIQSLVGYKDIESFYTSELKRILPEALLQNRMIQTVEIIDINKTKDKVTATLKITTSQTQKEVIISV